MVKIKKIFSEARRKAISTLSASIIALASISSMASAYYILSSSLFSRPQVKKSLSADLVSIKSVSRSGVIELYSRASYSGGATLYIYSVERGYVIAETEILPGYSTIDLSSYVAGDLDVSRSYIAFSDGSRINLGEYVDLATVVRDRLTLSKKYRSDIFGIYRDPEDTATISTRWEKLTYSDAYSVSVYYYRSLPESPDTVSRTRIRNTGNTCRSYLLSSCGEDWDCIEYEKKYYCRRCPWWWCPRKSCIDSPISGWECWQVDCCVEYGTKCVTTSAYDCSDPPPDNQTITCSCVNSGRYRIDFGSDGNVFNDESFKHGAIGGYEIGGVVDERLFTHSYSSPSWLGLKRVVTDVDDVDNTAYTYEERRYSCRFSYSTCCSDPGRRYRSGCSSYYDVERRETRYCCEGYDYAYEESDYVLRWRIAESNIRTRYLGSSGRLKYSIRGDIALEIFEYDDEYALSQVYIDLEYRITHTPEKLRVNLTLPKLSSNALLSHRAVSLFNVSRVYTARYRGRNDLSIRSFRVSSRTVATPEVYPALKKIGVNPSGGGESLAGEAISLGSMEHRLYINVSAPRPEDGGNLRGRIVFEVDGLLYPDVEAQVSYKR